MNLYMESLQFPVSHIKFFAMFLSTYLAPAFGKPFYNFIHYFFTALLHFTCTACLHSSTSPSASPAFSPLVKSFCKGFSCDVKERVPCCPSSGGSWVSCALLVFRKPVEYFLFHHLVLPSHYCSSVLQLFNWGKDQAFFCI